MIKGGGKKDIVGSICIVFSIIVIFAWLYYFLTDKAVRHGSIIWLILILFAAIIFLIILWGLHFYIKSRIKKLK